MKNGESVHKFLNYLTRTSVRFSVCAEGVICIEKRELLLKLLDQLTEEEIEAVLKAYAETQQHERD